MMRALYYSKQKIFLFVILFLYTSLVIFGVYYHEPWRDEALVWNIAREETIGEIFNNVKYSTPVLWFLTLMPFAKSGFPYETMSIVHAFIAISAVALLLFFARIPLLIKILFLFSYYMAYEYAVIARNYVLEVFLLFAIATVYPRRFTNPIPIGVFVALLFHVNSYSLGIAIGLTIMLTIEYIFKRKPTRDAIISIACMGLSAILLLWTLLPMQAPIRNVPMETHTQFRNVLRETVIPFFETSPLPHHMIDMVTSIAVILTTCLLISFTMLLVRHKLLLILTAIIFGWHILLNVFLHVGYLRHHGLLLIYIIFLWWILGTKVSYAWEKIHNGIFVVALSVLLFMSVAFTAYIYYWDYRYPFTGAKDMAMYIKSHQLDRYPIISFTGTEGEAVLPYFDHKQFWFAEYAAYGYFPLSDPRYYAYGHGIGIWDVLDRVKQNFSQHQKIVLLLTVPIPEEEKNYKLLHTSFTKYMWGGGEDFWLYTNK